MSVYDILNRLEGVKQIGHKKWKAKCAAHKDDTPSLYITEISDGRILIKDFGGCGACDIMSAIGLTLSDLFPDGKLGEWKSFNTIESDVEARRDEKKFKDRVTLQLAMEKRYRGERLSESELKAEREAFERTRPK